MMPRKSGFYCKVCRKKTLWASEYPPKVGYFCMDCGNKNKHSQAGNPMPVKGGSVCPPCSQSSRTFKGSCFHMKRLRSSKENL